MTSLFHCTVFQKKKVFLHARPCIGNCLLFSGRGTVGVHNGSLAVWGHRLGYGKLFPFNIGPPTPILGPGCFHLESWIHINRTSLLQTQPSLGAWVTSAPLFCPFSKTFHLFQPPHLFPSLTLPLLLANLSLSALMHFLYYATFPAKQNWASRNTVKLLIVVWDGCNVVWDWWEASNCLLLRGSPASLPVPVDTTDPAKISG